MFDLDNPKLIKLAELEGFADPSDLIEANVIDSICPTICMETDCDAIDGMEPDQRKGYCFVCGKNSMQSALVIAGMI